VVNEFENPKTTTTKYEEMTQDLTNRSSEWLAVVKSTFDVMKRMPECATLAASGGSALSG
jgi:hypothetical protein